MLYPTIEPRRHGMLVVGSREKIYWEECGDPSGEPIVFVHGGPGAGCSEVSRRFFNPKKYRVILFDQRGCGRSKSTGETTELSDLTLEHMVQDMECLREHLGINSWILFGGSWGTTLALAYAKLFPKHVKGLLLRGVFTASQVELAWLYQEGGASQIFPQEWTAFSAIHQLEEKLIQGTQEFFTQEIKKEGRHLQTSWKDHLSAYLRVLQSGEKQLESDAAFSWASWEHSIMSVQGLPKLTTDNQYRNRSMALQSCHLFLNDAWLRDEKRWSSFTDIEYLPLLIVQGQYDIVTPMKTAFELHQRWGNSRLLKIQGAGHASSDPELTQALIHALDEWSFN